MHWMWRQERKVEASARKRARDAAPLIAQQILQISEARRNLHDQVRVSPPVH